MLFLANIFSTIFNKNCSSFICDELPTGQCISYDEQSNTHTVQTCSPPYECPPVFYGNSTCQLPESMQYHQSWPGESCLTNDYCHYGYWKDNICVGAGYLQYCHQSDDCDVGLYCLDNLCKKQLQEGDLGCNEHYHWVNTAGCNTKYQEGQCVRYGTLAPGEVVGNAEEDKELCMSLSTVRINESSYCTSVVQSASTFPVNCTTDADCNSTRDEVLKLNYSQQCNCGLSTSPSSTCNPFPGDMIGLQYNQYFMRLIESREIQKCNTVRRFSQNCLGYWWIDEVANPMYYYYSYLSSNYSMYERTYKVPTKGYDCVSDIYHAEFETIQDQIYYILANEEFDEGDLANFIMAALLVILV